MRRRTHARRAGRRPWAGWAAGASIALMAVAGPADVGADLAVSTGEEGHGGVGHGAEAGAPEGDAPALRIVASLSSPSE